MQIETVGQLLYWSYANLAMAHAAVSDRAERYGQKHFIIRAKLYAGLNKQTMNLGALTEDERLKMVLPQACCYCAAKAHLSIDHLIATKRGGVNAGENIVWACRACNSSKGARDVLEWLSARGEFPPLFLLRRYLKVAIGMCKDRELLGVELSHAPELPFSIAAVPTRFPRPNELRLWVSDGSTHSETRGLT